MLLVCYCILDESCIELSFVLVDCIINELCMTREREGQIVSHQGNSVCQGEGTRVAIYESATNFWLLGLSILHNHAAQLRQPYYQASVTITLGRRV